MKKGGSTRVAESDRKSRAAQPDVRGRKNSPKGGGSVESHIKPKVSAGRDWVMDTVNHRGRSSKSSSALRKAAIVVIGRTGSGKSRFTSHFTDDDVQIGHGLSSCTTEATAHRLHYDGKYNLYLVDTPGFDDTTTSDSVVLKEIAFALASLYQAGVKLLGLIYFTRITDIRMSGSAIKALRLFEKLCGDEGFQSVVLASTMWDRVDAKTGEDRERELCNNKEFWGRMIAGKAKLARLAGDQASAHDLVTDIVKRDRSTVLNIQRELVDEALDLDQTEAGDFILDDFLMSRRRYRTEISEVELSINEARAAEDKVLVTLFTEQKKNLENLIRTADSAQAILNIGFEGLSNERPHWDPMHATRKDTRYAGNSIREQIAANPEDNIKLAESEDKKAILRSQRERKILEAEKSRLKADLGKQRAPLKAQRKPELEKSRRQNEIWLKRLTAPLIPSANPPRNPSAVQRSQTLPTLAAHEQFDLPFRQPSQISAEEGRPANPRSNSHVASSPLDARKSRTPTYEGPDDLVRERRSKRRHSPRESKRSKSMYDPVVAFPTSPVPPIPPIPHAPLPSAPAPSIYPSFPAPPAERSGLQGRYNIVEYAPIGPVQTGGPMRTYPSGGGNHFELRYSYET